MHPYVLLKYELRIDLNFLMFNNAMLGVAKNKRFGSKVSGNNIIFSFFASGFGQKPTLDKLNLDSSQST